jgi:hypothetical protein
MKGKGSGLVWGILLLLAGVALLADRLGWVDFSNLSTDTWFYIFVGAALFFFLIYFLNGVRNWGVLFPAFIFAALALTIWMADNSITDAFMGVPILLAIAIPFYIGFILDRKSWGLLIPAWILTVLAFITLTADMVNGTLIGAVFMFAVAVPFLVVFLLNRSRWWALIPAWVTFVLGMITLFAETAPGNLIGALFMYSVALPFLVVYLANRTRKWALIPAAALAFLGTIPLLDTIVGGEWMGIAVTLLFSAVFFFVYFRWQGTWWALIPAGFFASISVVVLLSIIFPQPSTFMEGVFNGVLLLGLGLTFGALWLLRGSQPTAWARFPAIALLAAGVLAFFFGGNTNLFWAIALLLAGILLVGFSLFRKKPADQA